MMWVVIGWWERKCIDILILQVGGGSEDRMISELFLLIILWEDQSQFLLVPGIFFEFDDEIDENMWLEPVLKSGKDLVGRLNAHGRSSLRWLVNLEEEEWD